MADQNPEMKTNPEVKTNPDVNPHSKEVKVEEGKDVASVTAGDGLKIVLVSKDGKTFETELRIARSSATIDTMIKDLNLDEQPDKICDEPLNLPNVDSAILIKVLEFGEHHKDEKDPKVAEDGKLTDWDEKFFNELKDAEDKMKMMFDVIQAANYLDMKFLLDVGCQFVANLMKGKKPEEIREMFDIENDFSDEEYKRIVEETKWAFE